MRSPREAVPMIALARYAPAVRSLLQAESRGAREHALMGPGPAAFMVSQGPEASDCKGRCNGIALVLQG